MDMDFNKGFLTKIKLVSKDYTWTQPLEYERVAFQSRTYFEIGHIVAHCAKLKKKADPKDPPRKSTW
jgi:hypothetical protein